jgi:hypothetical protein
MKGYNYKLADLMKMLRDQRRRRYQGINVLLSIFGDDSIEPMRRNYLIIAGLRAIGLYEIGNNYDRRKDFNDAPKKVNGKIKGEIVPAELFRCHLMNAIVQFDFILN